MMGNCFPVGVETRNFKEVFLPITMQKKCVCASEKHFLKHPSGHFNFINYDSIIKYFDLII